MKVLFLDDDENRHDNFRGPGLNWVIVRAYSYDEAIQKLVVFSPFDLVCLDHDLSYLAAIGQKPEDEKTGADVARYIAEMPRHLRPKQAIIHSWNRDGRVRMAQILADAGIPVKVKPFSV